MQGEVRERLVRRFGPSVLAWCEELPSLVAGLAERWGLAVHESGGGGTARVYRCMRESDGSSVWLKLTPDPIVAAQEAAALRAWAGLPSVVGLLAYDPAAAALLLAGVEPGLTLRERPWGLDEVARLLTELRGPADPPTGLPSLAARVDFVFDLAERRGAPTHTRAAALELAGSGPVGLVHGDLHPGNVLVGSCGPVAIDPRPCLGDPDFDLVDWAMDGVTDAPALRDRIAALCARVPGASAGRVLAWCRALAPIIAVPGRDDPGTAFLLSLA